MSAGIATVTSVNPYEVQLDGASLPLNIAPIVLSTVNVGDAVWVEFFGQQIVVLGRIQDGAVPQLGSSEDLNSFVYAGVWNQPLAANADPARNYPEALAGVLEVIRGDPSGDAVHQRFSASDGSVVYWRTYFWQPAAWSAWTVLAAAASTYAPVSPVPTSANFTSDGAVRLERAPDGKKRLFIDIVITRINNNFGALSTTGWTGLGSVLPAETNFSASQYFTGWATTGGGSGTLPVSVFINANTGDVEIKGMTGITPTINVNDLVTIQATITET